MKWTPYGKNLTEIEFFVKKNRFLPDASQKSESAAAGGGGGESVSRGSKPASELNPAYPE